MHELDGARPDPVVDSNLKKVWLEDSYLAATGARAHMEFMKVC
jgi:hypothetical protein